MQKEYNMDLKRFQQMIAAGEPLAGEEMIAFMREQSDDTRRLLFDLNGSYHTPEEIVTLFSQITNSKIDNSFRLFPPFYTEESLYQLLLPISRPRRYLYRRRSTDRA